MVAKLDRFGTRVLQIQCGPLGEPGREDGDVTKPSVVLKVLSLTGVHGHVAAALLAEMQDVQRSACFENYETEFGLSRCFRLGGVKPPVLWERVAKYVLWKAEEKWKAWVLLSAETRQPVRAAGFGVGGQPSASL